MPGLVTIAGEGRRPAATAAGSGPARNSSTAKHAATMVMRAITNASSWRNPRCCSSRISSTSAAVSAAPMTSGKPKRSWSAIAVPITSARSQAMIASSHTAHSVRLTAGG